jgi:hypothetical protein
VPNPLTTVFYIFQNEQKLVNWKTHLYGTPKFTRICMLIEWKIRNNVPFGKKFKFEREFELKILKEKCF